MCLEHLAIRMTWTLSMFSSQSDQLWCTRFQTCWSSEESSCRNKFWTNTVGNAKHITFMLQQQSCGPMGWTGPLHWTLSPTLSMRFWLTSDICEVCFFGEQVSVTASPLNRCWFRVLNCMLNSFVFIYMCLFHGWTSKPTGFIMFCKAQTVEIKPGFFSQTKIPKDLFALWWKQLGFITKTFLSKHKFLQNYSNKSSWENTLLRGTRFVLEPVGFHQVWSCLFGD